MKFGLLFLCVRLSYGQSHVQVSLGTASYRHGDESALEQTIEPISVQQPSYFQQPEIQPISDQQLTYFQEPEIQPISDQQPSYFQQPFEYQQIEQVANTVPEIQPISVQQPSYFQQEFAVQPAAHVAVHVPQIPVHTAHHAVVQQPAYVHTAPVYQPQIYHNCSVEQEVVKAEVCTPSVKTTCKDVELDIKIIVDKEQCNDIHRTVCSVETDEVENEVCVYTYASKEEETTAKTVKVEYTQTCKQQYVTLCQTSAGYGYQNYGNQWCKEEAQPVCYNTPSVIDNSVNVTISYPEASKNCEQKPISLPKISCKDVFKNECITVPEVESSTVSVEKCETTLGEPECEEVELSLPKQTCVEVGYHAPVYNSGPY